MKRFLTCGLLTVALCSLAAPDAEACVPIPDADAVTGLEGRRGVVRIEDDTFSMTFQNQTTTVNGDFAWVIPIPGVPDKVDEASEQFLNDLDRVTAPMIEQSDCFKECPSEHADAGALPGNSQSDVSSDVTVWSSGSLGDLEYVVVSADTSVELLQWLTERGFNLDTALVDVLDDYIGRSFSFFAAKVTGAAASEESISVPAVRFTFPRATVPIIYPTVISAYGRTEPLSTTLWVISDAGSYVPKNYPYALMDAEEYTSINAYKQDLEKVMLGNDGATFAVQYAQAGFSWERTATSLYGSGSAVSDEVVALNDAGTTIVRMHANLNPAVTTQDLELAPASVSVDGWYQTGCPNGITEETCDSPLVDDDPTGASDDSDGGCSLGAKPAGAGAFGALLFLAALTSLTRRRR